MTVYTGQIRLARDLIARFGKTVTLQRAESTVSNPVTEQGWRIVREDDAVRAVFVGNKTDFAEAPGGVPGALEKITTATLLIAGSGLTFDPDVDCTVIDGDAV